MTVKEKITFIPPINLAEDGWLNIDGEILRITNIHHFDDFGHTLETFTLEDGQEVYSYDEQELTTELYEG
tara:strand:- start:2530 stop:2739 length:210 start_codon:yes stop_codon:yes gene_type:complete